MNSIVDELSDTAVQRHELKRKTFGSVAWTLVRIGTDQGFAFLVFALLARLLTPTTWGCSPWLWCLRKRGN